jgi:nucleoside 2-deoxyribosyltransferase
VIVGRGDNQDAEDLLEVIKAKLEYSSYAVFDATAGNANVSLEYGYAEAKNIPRVLYMSSHKAAHKSKDPSIISDLAGKRRNQYSNEDKLFGLMQEFSTRHPYTQRFEKTLASEFRRQKKGAKKRSRA